MSEQYAAVSTTVGLGGYTSGSGSLLVASTTGFLAPSRCYIADPTTFAVKVILKITAITDGTHLAVTAEGSDANANYLDKVFACLTVGAMDQIRADQSRVVTGALPTDMYQGDILWPTDDLMAEICTSGSGSGTAVQPMGPVHPCGAIPALTWTNQGSAVQNTRNGSVGIVAPAASGNSLHILRAATPGSTTPWSIIFGVSYAGASAGETGVCLVESSSSTSKVIEFAINESNVYVNYWTNPTTYAGTTPVSQAAWRPGSCGVVWFKLKADGTNFIFSYGANQWDLVPILTKAKADFFSSGIALYAGFFTSPNNSVIGSAITCVAWIAGS